jgi:hypothetical protein
LFTRTSSEDSRSPSTLENELTPDGCERSAGRAWHQPSRASTSAAARQASAFRAVMYTRAPARTKPSAIMNPIPAIPGDGDDLAGH